MGLNNELSDRRTLEQCPTCGQKVSVVVDEEGTNYYANEAECEALDLRAALNKPLRETILAVLNTMPVEAAPEHLAAMIESQVRAWQIIGSPLPEIERDLGEEDNDGAA